jgi:Lrp/AsnC family leucine-responsive transcriptional regulator
MSQKASTNLDDIDCNILAELQPNARIPFTELGRRVGLSTPSVIERVRKMEDDGIIVGYRAHIDPAKIGRTVRAFIKVSVAGDKLAKFVAVAKKAPGILECHRVTGSESYIVQVAVRDTVHLEQTIDSLMPYVATNTSMILASPIEWNPMTPEI